MLQLSQTIDAAGVQRDACRFRDTSPEAIARKQTRFDQATDRIAAMPIRDPRSPQEIMYDLNEP